MAGIPHHVTQRGNRKEPIFRDEFDRTTYLKMLLNKASHLNLRVWSYVLMSNHVHIICVPEKTDDLSEVIGTAHSCFARYFNARHGLCGHLFQDRFFSSPMDDSYLYNAVRYVERNPVRAGLVERAEHYAWSSAQAHCGLRVDPILSHDLPIPVEFRDWSSWLGEPDEDGATKEIRLCTRRGRPLGSKDFVSAVNPRPAKR